MIYGLFLKEFYWKNSSNSTNRITKYLALNTVFTAILRSF